jgi:histidyl-tRNA synthetase
VCGGGRSDTLLESLGGPAMPALGFGMGDVVLGELLRARGLMPPSAPSIDFWVIADEGAAERLLPTVGALRRRGRSVEYALRDQAVGKQLKAAASAGARRALILRADGGAAVRPLDGGDEATVDLASWLATA